MVTIRVFLADRETNIETIEGVNLREALLQAGISPYTTLTKRVNCGGRGLCATCGVWIEQSEPRPEHWHDRLASQFGYPRLSCQIHVDTDMSVRILNDKWIWGARNPSKARRRASFK